MIRLIIVFYIFALLSAQGVTADELDFPSNSVDGYSNTDFYRYACLRDDLIRLVYLEYSGPVGEPPCSVIYEKSPPEQSSTEVLWRALHSTVYCELRAREFVEILRSWGWKCGLFRDVFGTKE